MKAWLLLAGAILTEVTGSMALQAAVEHPGWYALTVPAYVVAFGLLGAVLREGMPLGVAYGIWGALGVALTAVLAARLFGHALTGTTVAGIVLVVVGVLLVELGSQAAHRERART